MYALLSNYQGSAPIECYYSGGWRPKLLFMENFGIAKQAFQISAVSNPSGQLHQSFFIFLKIFSGIDEFYGRLLTPRAKASTGLV
jgi:hypothetical protein